MKAISPVRSVRSCYEAVCCLSDQSLAIARGSSDKSLALEEPMNLLYDMNDCYSKLRELVPGIPQGTKVSQVEILQHVIDYIFDLQIVLEEQAEKGQEPSAETSLLSLKVRVCWASARRWGGKLEGASDVVPARRSGILKHMIDAGEHGGVRCREAGSGSPLPPHSRCELRV